jgi:pimeloyl-ACP methyl ester carboxylesterase
MSSAGPDTAPWPKPSVLRKFLHRPPRRGGRQARIDHTLGLLVAIGRLHDTAEIDGLRARVAEAVDRAWRPDGIARQLLAVLADRDRSDEIVRIECPTRIIHGEDDPLIRPRAAHYLKQLIPQARLELIEGMAHYLPQDRLPQITAALVQHLTAVSSKAGITDPSRSSGIR